MINGIKVALHVKTQNGTDDFGQPIYTDSTVYVYNVLVGQPSAEEIINASNLYGKKLVYTLAIPKGDENEWIDTEVEFFGKVFKTFGEVTQGIDSNIPLKWNKQIKVAMYE